MHQPDTLSYIADILKKLSFFYGILYYYIIIFTWLNAVLPLLNNSTTSFKIMSFNIVFQHQVVVNFKVTVPTFGIKVINTAAFTQVNMVTG